MTKSGFDRLQRNTLSRRGVIGLASAGTVLTFWQRKVHGFPLPSTTLTASRQLKLPIATRPAHRSSSTPRPMCGGVPAAFVR